ncbi:hypothetical protein JY651_39645 [Pyxidicoccus parkwayensis]|uniref:HEAT repeat domain-containing protein n=1 Tax=Pyxidicoccus parkwayensis TaxID=2813578 RepID=A0ABX7NYU3_9BACT|nr:hypothetical protein [Pyxidicoccus parkwaysis]QSQ21248.1 hypothetical protein JY651_39645 [Pyxidicoccus parkwaysis]
MKKQVLFSSILCMALLLCSGRALALDIPPGGDALGHQLAASQVAVIAQLRSNDIETMSFATSVPLLGETPSEFRLVQDAYTADLRLAVGNYYLLFLAQDERGALSLATSIYSIVDVDPREAESYRAAIADYQQTQRDPRAFKRVALSMLGSSIPYLHYSAMSDLARRGLFTSDEGELLAKFANGGTSHPEVRKLALRQVGNLRLDTYADLLGAVLGNREEPTSVRVAALDGLRFMGRTDVIQRQAASVGESTSPKLKARLMEALNSR